MSESNRTLRVRTQVNSDSFINVNINQDIDVLEVLSLKIKTKNAYKLHQSKYGCVAGRVLANNAVGVPNAKVSIFIKADDDWINDSVFNALYPFYDIKVKDDDNKRYNLLPEYSVNECYTPVGTFPSKRMVLDDDNILEVYNNFYKFTTKTNQAGDYMIFGVPVGTQELHLDVDLSDIGFLSQKPRDMISNGYNEKQFENANKFKSSTNLDVLPQIISQDTSVYVYPFWGEEGDDMEDVKITRKDINLSYEFKTYCVFMGSIIVDDNSNGVSPKCIPTDRMGKMDKLTTGAGTIEMIRKKPDGNVESFQINGTQLIDGNGVWCYQIPMNLDYVKSDEYGNIVPTDDPSNGIPTRARVRFRVSLNDFESDSGYNHLAKVLVPNNPKTDEIIEYASDSSNVVTDFEPDYNFGSETKDDEFGTKSFRDLFWNNVYTVKQFIPRIQKGNSQNNKHFSGIKGTNINGANNSIPYNNMRVHLTFMFVLQCAMFKALIWIIKMVNKLMCRIGIVARKDSVKCLTIGDGVCPDLDGWYFAPGCSGKHDQPFGRAWDELKGGDDNVGSIDSNNKDSGETICLTNTKDYLLQCIEINLAKEYEVINFDFYNDWLNGVLYIPRWFAKQRKRRFRIINGKRRTAPALIACKTSDHFYRKYTQQCALEYKYDSDSNTITDVVTKIGCKSDDKLKCHRAKGRKKITIFNKDANGIHHGGLLKVKETYGKQKVYYFKPCEWFYRDDRYIKVNLFATDIVLIGSLNECDTHGIPQAFKYLKSSSYFMPSNLASTNMDENGNMYMVGGSSICNNTKITKALTLATEVTFDTYNKWSKKQDFYEAEPKDIDEYAVTETSGIDWGYNGPNQKPDSNDKLYKPGGHFLGISCVKPEVSIKSCLNLTRMCELGVTQSSRNYVATRNGNDFRYTYIVPNGLISKDDITDYEFRSMFATMNYNGLKTKYDSETNYLKYDFISIRPTNFSGEFRNITSANTNYNNINLRDDDETSSDSTNLAFTRSNENVSHDYYNFRFGFDGTEEMEDQGKHFLLRDKENFALPVYENSFYFYFGLRDGSTALDTFYNDFFATCSDENEDNSNFIISKTDPSICEINSGKLDVAFNGVDSPYSISLSSETSEYYFYVDDEDNINVSSDEYYKHFTKDSYYYNTDSEYADGDLNVILSNKFETELTAFTIYNIDGTIEGKKYTLNLESSDGSYKDVDVTMKINTNNVINAFITSKTDFDEKPTETSQKLLFESRCKTTSADEGCINVQINNIDAKVDGTIISCVLLNSEYYAKYVFSSYNTDAYKKKINTIVTSNIDSETMADFGFVTIDKINVDETYVSFQLPVWKANDDFTIYAIVECGDNLFMINICTNTVSAPMDIDLYFYDNDCLYSETIAKVIGKKINYLEKGELNQFAFENLNTIDTTNWWEYLLRAYYLTTGFKETSETLYLNKKEKNNNEYYTFEYSDSGSVGGTLLEVTPKILWNLKKALFYTSSAYNFDTGNAILVGTSGGTLPYKEYIAGSTEELIENDTDSEEYDMRLDIDGNTLVTTSTGYTSGVTAPYYKNLENSTSILSKDSFYLPTFGFSPYKPLAKSTSSNDGSISSYGKNFSLFGQNVFEISEHYSGGTYYDCYGNDIGGKNGIVEGYKKHYRMYSTDLKGARVPANSDILLPSIYRPFFFNALLFIEDENKYYVDLKITNGITYGGNLGNVYIKCNNQIQDISESGFSNKFSIKDSGNESATTNDYGIRSGNTDSDNQKVRYAFDNYYSNNERYRVFYNTTSRFEKLNDISSISFNIKVTEGYPKDLENSGDLKEIEINYSNIGFPSTDSSKDANVDENIVFISTTVDIYGCHIDNNFYLSANNSQSNGATQQTSRNDTYYGLFGLTGSTTFTFNDISTKFYDYLYPDSESETEVTVDTAIKNVKDCLTSGATYVYAIYDNWTRDYGYTNVGSHKLWDDMIKHTSIMSIVRVYTKEQFDNIIDKNLRP